MKVYKNNYEVNEYLSGYYGICPVGSFGGDAVWGGDPADKDCYDKELAEHIYQKWDGTLIGSEDEGLYIDTSSI